METKPLAERMRPTSLDSFYGQSHLVGQNGFIRMLLGTGHIPSMIFWGPPGVGKTTLAEIISKYLSIQYYSLSAVSAGVKDVKEIVEQGRRYGRVLLFLDEIHRFNKSQQDALLAAVEKGYVILIGATTENPSFEVNHALLSRTQVMIFQKLSDQDIQTILERALKEDEFLSLHGYTLNDDFTIAKAAMGDARKALTILEISLKSLGDHERLISKSTVNTILSNPSLHFDKGGEQHYDIASAFIKSIRGSDPNAALYWLARMLKGGEDPKFVARRLLILASEDIGNANPTALVLANSCFQSVHVLGMPEARIILAQTCTYLSSSPKSNASYLGINQAMDLVDRTGDRDVPLHLRNAPTVLMKKLGYGKEYKYSHDYKGNFAPQEYFPEGLEGTVLYNPGDNSREIELRAFLKSKWGSKYSY